MLDYEILQEILSRLDRITIALEEIAEQIKHHDPRIEK